MTKKTYISIENVALDLGILDHDLLNWVKEKNIEIMMDFRDRPAISSEAIKELVDSTEYLDKLKKSISFDSINWDKSYFLKNELSNLRILEIEKYRILIDELEFLHKGILETVNFHEDESPVKAAYLLFSKAISCLMMGCDNLHSGYWFIGSAIREIDEAIHLARYFVVLSGTDKGDDNLKKWFRQNHTPNHSECRDALSNNISSIFEDIEKNDHLQLMKEIYNKQSKWIHPTFGVIREVTKFDVSDEIEINQCTYGKTSHELKLLELTHHFRSSIWSTFQLFTLCFAQSLPLSDEKLLKLSEINHQFKMWAG